MLLPFDKGQIPKNIGNPGQVDQAAVGEGHDSVLFHFHFGRIAVDLYSQLFHHLLRPGINPWRNDFQAIAFCLTSL